MITLYAIGFTKKSAERFFGLLRDNHVKQLVDVRISNGSQLAGFAKGKDLEFFVKEICHIPYKHIADFAPTKELLDKWHRQEVTWEEYEKIYTGMLKDRDIGTLYVSCSLGLLHEGWHHKLAAGVFECDGLKDVQNTSLDDCEQQLAQLLDQKEELESRIQALRTKFQKQMEMHHMERFSSNKLSVSYFSARQVMQFDSTAFKTDYPELYEQYCRPRQREASITVKRNV